MLTAVMLALYLTVGESQPITELVFYFPPVAWWLFLLLPVTLLLLRPASWKDRIGLLATNALFFLLLVEWGGLVRWFIPPPSSEVRIVSFNTGGHSGWDVVLRALAPLQADLILLQESPDGPLPDFSTTSTVSPTASFTGWHVLHGGDCTLLSRWPLKQLPSRSVGPWDDPLLAAIRIPAMDQSVLVGNVRFALPALEFLPVSREARVRHWTMHRDRVAQYARLASLLEETAQSLNPAAVIWGGDINADSSARSVDRARSGFTDAWTIAGRGWGGTILSHFPIGRIDHIYSRGRLHPVNCRALPLPISDHRAVVADYRITPPASPMN
jgi:endonuclease/exonuclease/phosphatase (EEP) superfamily protein YafD